MDCLLIGIFFYFFLWFLKATATGLEEKLGKLAPTYATAGSISQYFVQRFVVSLRLGSDAHSEL